MINKHTKAERTRNLRYKRPALASMGYEKAESDGLLVVLPCKVGDSVFSLLSPPHYKHGVVYEYKVVFIGINDSEDMGYGLFNVKSVKGEWMYSFNFSDIGKTVFLTRAEAEAALGGDGDG